MADNSNIVRAMRERQQTIRRQLDQRNISLKALSMDSGIGYSTLLSYFPNPDGAAEPAQMPVSAIYMLCEHVPNDLLSLLLPDGNMIVSVPEGIDHDALEAWCIEFLRIKGEAHRPNSPAGRDLSDCEDERLDRHVATLRGISDAA
ncbi:MAG: hypothetical protein J7530_08160 [Novosphingobium sp.]|nr:hypothetical protein [Novosphingobium sp.]